MPSEALWVQPPVVVLIAGMQRARIRRFLMPTPHYHFLTTTP
ncbi:hypothetical protein XOCgx_3518 [Xanthomonas oryzae pv. oryzicola]|nr:hypothetical protein XOCgx_3518 [Xanthomonas oryzae pv. oryzicola]